MADPVPARPTAYDTALADAVCAAVARGESLHKACDAPDMPARDTVLVWAEADAAFAKRLDAARRLACAAFEDDILAIADGFGLPEPERPLTASEQLQRDRVRIAVRQWLMAKRDPAKYGRAARPLSLEAGAEDDPAAREATEWVWAEADGLKAAFQAHDELIAAGKNVIWGGEPLRVATALIGGRPIPLAPFIAEDLRSFDSAALSRHQEARVRAVRAHRARPDASDDDLPEAEVLRAAEGFLAKRYGAHRSLSPDRRSFERKFIQIYADIAHAWPDDAPPPI